MHPTLKSTVLVALALVSFRAAAGSSVCEIFLDTPNIDSLLEDAAELEVVLLESMSEEFPLSTRTASARRLADLEPLIENLLEAAAQPRGIDLMDLQIQLNTLVTGTPEDPIGSEAAISPRNDISLARGALRDREDLQPYLRNKFDEFIADLVFFRVIDLPARWGLEKLSSIDFGENTYTVRLNQGYRVIFFYKQPRAVIIHRVSKSLTHR